MQAEPAVQIAIDRRTGADRRRHPVGRDAAPFDRIDVRAVGTDADTVARSERGVAVERKASDIARGHPPYELAHRLGRVERRDTRRPPHKEILRIVKLFAGSGVKSSRVSPTDARRQSPREAIASSSRLR